ACTGADQVCIVDPNAASGDRCATRSTAQCNPTQSPSGCTGNQVCVQDIDTNHSPVCRTTEAAAVLAELPRGTGLMPSLSFLDNADTSVCPDAAGCAVIAYYDSLKRAVKAVQAAHAGSTPAFGAPVEIDGDIDNDARCDGGTVASKRDTGRWPALAIGQPGQPGGRIAIAFADQSNQQLLVYQSNGLTAHSCHLPNPSQTGLIRIVDSGKPATGAAWHPQSFPGVQTSIAFSGAKLLLAYQDATPVDLVFAKYDPATGTTTSRESVPPMTGAAGFWPHIAIAGGTPYVSSAS